MRLGRALGIVVFVGAVAAATVVSTPTPASARNCPQLGEAQRASNLLTGWSALMRCYGHPVTASRTPPESASRSTVFVTARDDEISPQTIAVLNQTLDRGGRVVVVGSPGTWSQELGASSPRSAGDGRETWSRVGEGQVVRDVNTVKSAALNAFVESDSALLAAGGLALVTDGARAGGGVTFLADVSVFTNANLDQADNAQLALNLAGPEGRPVVIYTASPPGQTPIGGIDLRTDQGQQNQGQQNQGQQGQQRQDEGGGLPPEEPPSGLDALPFGWKFALAALAVAALLYAISRAKRIGPPEHADRALPPRRVAFVDALGESLARAKDPAGAGSVLQARGRARIRALGGLDDDAPPEAFVRSARELGLSDADIAALQQPDLTDNDLVRTARVVAKLEGT